MSFNLYFAGWGAAEADKYLQEKNVNRLFSQLNEWQHIVEWSTAGHNKLFIDSGAFSVHHSGKTVNIDDYIKRINDNPQIPIWVELDVIPYPVLNTQTAKHSSDASWENYLYMKERVADDVCLLPLYHFGEPKDALLRILNTPVNGKLPDYIGVGGRHGVSTAQQDSYFNEIFALVQKSDNPNVKIHAFGMTVLKLLEKYPFYSADSTTWAMIGINGGIITDSCGIVNISENSKYNKDNVANFPKEAKERLNAEILAYGYTLEELQTNYKSRLKFNIDYFINWATNYEYKGATKFTSRRLF